MRKISFKSSSLKDCLVIDLPKIQSGNGSITALNNEKDFFFSAKRVYYLYDIPGGVKRGGHSHKGLYQLIVAVSGSFDVVLDDSKIKKSVLLNRPNRGLLIVPGIWRELVNFSSGSICLVLASEEFDEFDYIREYEIFRKLKE